MAFQRPARNNTRQVLPDDNVRLVAQELEMIHSILQPRPDKIWLSYDRRSTSMKAHVVFGTWSRLTCYGIIYQDFYTGSILGISIPFNEIIHALNKNVRDSLSPSGKTHIMLGGGN